MLEPSVIDRFLRVDGKRHQFDYNSPNDHLIDSYFPNTTKVAEGIYDGPGCISVNDTTPANYNPQ